MIKVSEIANDASEEFEEPYFVPMTSNRNGCEIIKDPDTIFQMEEEAYLKPLLRYVRYYSSKIIRYTI